MHIKLACHFYYLTNFLLLHLSLSLSIYIYIFREREREREREINPMLCKYEKTMYSMYVFTIYE